MGASFSVGVMETKRSLLARLTRHVVIISTFEARNTVSRVALNEQILIVLR